MRDVAVNRVCARNRVFSAQTRARSLGGAKTKPA